MRLHGNLIAESPIYRGNARKTLFTRDGDGQQRLVSLAGEISGTAQSLMDAFVGQSRNGRNEGLLNRLWRRLYGEGMPGGLITKVECHLQKESYAQGNFFDLRMGIRLDEDRWAVDANANYKMETLFRNAVFDLILQVNDSVLKQADHADKLFYLLQELKAGRFWFGAGKSKGLGRCRLEIDLPFRPGASAPEVQAQANHLTIALAFNAANPVLVGWNWGKVDPDKPAFAAVEGQLLLEGLREIPDPIRERLRMSIGGPILSVTDWSQKLATFLPRAMAIWLREQSIGERESWSLTAADLAKLSKGRHGLSKKVSAALQPLTDTAFPSLEAAQTAITHALGSKSNMGKRVLEALRRETNESHELKQSAWQAVRDGLGFEANLDQQVSAQIEDEAALTKSLSTACQTVLPQLVQQVERQIQLLESDVWVDEEIVNREQHTKIKTMLRDGKIKEAQWGRRDQAPSGVSTAAWHEFIDDHSRVSFRHMLDRQNLNKSITNDINFMSFLRQYRDRSRQELAQPEHTDFRAGGGANQEVSRKYGKPYDTVFMRMLTLVPSTQGESAWEAYIPGSTIKGAFRKRASQILKTLWGETRETTRLLDQLFGKQGQMGQIRFSDAYLSHPDDNEQVWCSMDGIRMDPKTGQPAAMAKTDYLYAYGDQLAFQLQLDLQDLREDDLAGMALLKHLLQDFQLGDIPLGGEKTNGFGWVQAQVKAMHWLTGAENKLTPSLFGSQALTTEGLWQTLHLTDETAATALQPALPLIASIAVANTPPKAKAGFISHRAFGGYCGTLSLEGEVLTPLSVQESGEPSQTVKLAGQSVNGWDFFSMSPAEAALRGEKRRYALPSKSLKGMVQHIYAISSNSKTPGTDIGQLNPTENLFGWVGRGPNQSLMGRLSLSFGLFETPELAWFKIPYPYGQWHYKDHQWQHGSEQTAQKLWVGDTWRLFPHTPLAPIVQRLETFAPDTPQAHYVRAILPGSRCHFTVRFWNLAKEELQRLIWSLVLEENLAHKMGNSRYLGFGSLRFKLLPESFLIDWVNRYAGRAEPTWRLALSAPDWLNQQVIQFHPDLKQALNADAL